MIIFDPNCAQMMKKKPTFSTRLTAIWPLGAVVLMMSSCKMPPREAWRQIQSEGLVGYIAAAPMDRQLGGEMDDPWLLDSTEYLAGYEPRGRRGSGVTSWGEDWDLEGGEFGVETALGERGDLLFTARPVPDREGVVYSPHAAGKFVDVSNFSAGEEVRCPHSGEVFLVPRFPTPTVAVADATTGERRERMRFENRVDPPVSSGRRPVVPPATDSGPTPPAARPDGLVAKRVPGRPDQVYSPYADRRQIVDVTGLRPGDRARCPFTNRVFVVPGLVARGDGEAGEIAKIADRIDFRVLGDRAGEGRLGAATPEPPAAPIPTAEWSGRQGYVLSPFGDGLIDVGGKPEGSVLRCPFSGKLFRVPARAR